MNNEEIKERLKEIWMQLLDVECVNDDDNYFWLGGTSLIAMKLISRIEETFSITFSLEELFEHTVFEQQVDYIRRNVSSISESLRECLIAEPDKWEEKFPLTDIQRSYWLGRQDIYAMGGFLPSITLNLKKSRWISKKQTMHGGN